MSARVILLNGPPGVGKTTVGRVLASLVPNGVCIHGDSLKEFVVSREDGAVRTGLAYINGASVAANFVEAGYDRVVFEFVFEERASVERFLAAFHPIVPVHLFTLWAPLETVVTRESSRPNRAPLGDRVVVCYQAIARNIDVLGARIETAALSPDAIARTILRLTEGCSMGLIRA